MNKIHPLYILGFFVLMVFFMVYESARTEEKISLKAQENARTQLLGKKIASLKERWKDPAKARKKIDAILAAKPFAAKVRRREKKQGLYKIRIVELDARSLDRLTGKVLNETLTLKSMKMVRNGDKNVTVDLEFVL